MEMCLHTWCGPFIMSFWCFAVLNYNCILLFMLSSTLIQNVTLFPILIWQKWTDIVNMRIFSFLETFRHGMITRQYGYPETSQNRPKFGKRKSRFQYLCLHVMLLTRFTFFYQLRCNYQIGVTLTSLYENWNQG